MAIDIAGKLGLSAGDSSSWGGGVAQNVRPVTDLSPHVDGGQASSTMTNAQASGSDQQNMYMCAAIVLLALVLLWVMGALVFRRIRL